VETSKDRDERSSLRAPSVDAVGVAHVPAGFARTPRRYPLGARIAAATILVALFTTVVTTTVASLARYCLTSQAGAPAAWPAWLRSLAG